MENDVEYWKHLYQEERIARNKAEQLLEANGISAAAKSQSNDQPIDEIVHLRSFDVKETEKRFQRLVEYAHDMICRLNLKGYFTYINPTVTELLGYTHHEMRSLHYLDIVEESARESVKAFYEQRIRDKEEFLYYELPVLSKDGKVVWVGLNLSIVYHRLGSPLFISGVARDITDAKLAKSRLENLITNLQSAVLLEDEERKIVLTNAEFCERFGIPAPPDQMIGADCSQAAEMSKGMFQEEEAFVQGIHQLLKNKVTVKNEVMYLKDGSVLERDYIPIFIDGRYGGHLWNYRDITESEHYQKELEIKNVYLEHNLRQQQLLADISFDLINEKVGFEDKINKTLERIGGFINVSRVYIFEDDEAGEHTSNTFEWCNSGIEPQIDELQDVPYSFMTYWPTTLLAEGMIFSEDITQLPQGVRDVLEPQGIKSLLVLPLRNKGRMFGFIGFDECTHHRSWDQSNIQLLKTISNLIANQYERRLDHQALLQSRKEALEAASAKEAFLANMSHEIRTPMNGVSGMIMALKRTATSTEQDYLLNTMQRAADNLLVILNDILDLSKIEAGKLKLDCRPFEFRTMFQQPVKILQHRIEEKGLTMQTWVDPNIANSFMGDPYRIDQVIMNLLGNAVKFTHSGMVLLEANLLEDQATKQRIQIKVKDDGIGMDAAFIDQLFEKFTQEDRDSAQNQGGTGLGLNIAKQLIDMMGGHIHVESTVGVGSTFTVELEFEVAEAVEAAVGESEVQEVDAQLKGKRILAAEDNELNRVVLETVLSHYEVDMTTVENGAEAVEALKHASFDLVLMDLQMPVMDGATAARTIRNELKLDVPIIALSADALKGELGMVQRDGMNGYVSKPFEEHQLIATIAKFVHGDPNLLTPETATEAEDATHTELYTLSKLDAMSRGRQEFILRMCDIFVQESRKNLSMMTEAFGQGDGFEVARLAHRMKPSIDNMGIDALHETVRNLERTKEESCRYFTEDWKFFNRHLSMVCDRIEAEVLNGNKANSDSNA